MKQLAGMALALLAAALLAACGGPSDDATRENMTPNLLGDVGVCTEVINDQCPEDMAVLPRDASKFYVAGKLSNATIGTTISAVLTYTGGTEPEELASTQVTIDQVNVSIESYPVFYFTNNQPWDAGSYSVKLQVENQQQDPILKNFSLE